MSVVRTKNSHLCKVMNASKLQKRRDAVPETHEQEPVQRSGVAHLGQVGARVQADGGQRQHGGDAQPHAVRGGLAVDPEGHPGQHHDQDAGHVHLD